MHLYIPVFKESIYVELLYFDVFDFCLDEADMAAFAALDDGTFPRIFDHRDPKMIA